MNKLLKTFVINLDDCVDRLAHVKTQLESINIEFERVAAIDFRGTSPNEHPKYSSTRALDIMGRELSGGEVGCYASHLKAAQRFLDSGFEFGLVLEDDIVARDDTNDTLKTLLDFLTKQSQSKWDIANLGHESRKLSQIIGDANGHDIQKSNYFPLDGHAILWTRQGAEKFIAMSDQIEMPVDHVFRRMVAHDGKGITLKPKVFDFDFSFTGDRSTLHRDRSIAATHKSIRYFAAEVKRQGYAYWRAFVHRIG